MSRVSHQYIDAAAIGSPGRMFEDLRRRNARRAEVMQAWQRQRELAGQRIDRVLSLQRERRAGRGI
jgi:hypothetical protein